MDIYNLTNLTNANNPLEIVQEVNTLSGGWLGSFILFTAFLLIFLVYKSSEHDTSETFVVASLLTVIISIIMTAMELLSYFVIIFPVIFFVASLIIYKTGE